MTELSVVIPVYNEENILEASVDELVRCLERNDIAYEIILAENGSTDRTKTLAERLAAADARIRWFSYPEPNYGGALREGICRAGGQFVVCEEIDVCDVAFHLRALALLRGGAADLVIGSKTMPGANDRRPAFRRLATRAYNGLLRVSLGFHGTDTHGLKAFRRTDVAPIAARCVVEHDVFASELVVRCERAGIRVVEIPVEIAEKRPPSIDLVRRVPRVLGNLGRLLWSIHGPQGR